MIRTSTTILLFLVSFFTMAQTTEEAVTLKPNNTQTRIDTLDLPAPFGLKRPYLKGAEPIVKGFHQRSIKKDKIIRIKYYRSHMPVLHPEMSGLNMPISDPYLPNTYYTLLIDPLIPDSLYSQLDSTLIKKKTPDN